MAKVIVKPEKLAACKHCGSSKIKLVQVKQIIKMNGRTYNGKWWRYECSACKMNYTTTDSDTISYAQFKDKHIPKPEVEI